MVDLLVPALREDEALDQNKEWRVRVCRIAANRIEELERASREKDNIAFIIDSHGTAHRTFTIIYTGEKTK